MLEISPSTSLEETGPKASSQIRAPLVVGTIPVLTSLSMRIYAHPSLTPNERQRNILYKFAKRPTKWSTNNPMDATKWKAYICGGAFMDRACKMQLLSSPNTYRVEQCASCLPTENCFSCFWARSIFDPVFVQRPHRFILDRWAVRPRIDAPVQFDQNVLNGGHQSPLVLLY